MLGPNELDKITPQEERMVKKLAHEVEEYFRTPRGQVEPYTLDPFTIGAGMYSDRVKAECAKRANAKGLGRKHRRRHLDRSEALMKTPL